VGQVWEAAKAVKKDVQRPSQCRRWGVIRDDTSSAALAELVNTPFRHPFAEHWGDGTTSASDGQRFMAGARAEATGNINPKYGNELGVLFYTHISDQYAPFHTQVINVGVRDATYGLDGLLYHESDLRIFTGLPQSGLVLKIPNVKPASISSTCSIVPARPVQACLSFHLRSGLRRY
jgi:TnpA family transposase